jgi:hypothetical protein
MVKVEVKKKNRDWDSLELLPSIIFLELGSWKHPFFLCARGLAQALSSQG